MLDYVFLFLSLLFFFTWRSPLPFLGVGRKCASAPRVGDTGKDYLLWNYNGPTTVVYLWEIIHFVWGGGETDLLLIFYSFILFFFPPNSSQRASQGM